MDKRKKLRQRIWLKYNKHCAYCGKVLEHKDMQVDHMTPKYFYDAYKHHRISSEELNSFRNLMPSCRRCNHYKREKDLEGFRRLMRTLHERIEEKYITKVAIDYGIVEIKPFSGKFYFEISTNNPKEDNLTDEEIDNQGDIDDDFNERSEGIEKSGGGPMTNYG